MNGPGLIAAASQKRTPPCRECVGHPPSTGRWRVLMMRRSWCRRMAGVPENRDAGANPAMPLRR
jgi:hypothetical protein